MASKFVYYQADGIKPSVAPAVHASAKAMAAPGSIFFYGGDVYDDGTNGDFAVFGSTYGDVLPRLGESAGNHDWNTASCAGYDTYWGARQPPLSLTRINNAQGSTIEDHHHYRFKLGNGWLGISVDCGPDATTALTPPALTLISRWITGHGGRNIIVFLHHNRLSRGNHSNNTSIDSLWQRCFLATGKPRVTAWVAGHNHNISIYSPRTRGSGPAADPPVSSRGIANGIQMFVSGNGGAGHYPQGAGAVGSMPDVYRNDTVYGFLEIKLATRTRVHFQNWSCGTAGTSGPTKIGPQVTISI